MIQKERLTEQFFEFVKIGSESGNEKDMGERLVKECRALGLQVVTDNAGASYGSNGFNVLAYLPGTMEGEPFLLSAHMDTVKPGNGIVPFIKDGVIMSGEDTILGGDDKSGICGILEAVRSILEDGTPHRAAEIVFSIGEEGGMKGAKAFDVSLLKSRRGYIFDSSGDVGKVIIGAPGQSKVSADVIGKRAHAGLAPETGISAIQVMAKAIAKMNLLRIDEETTCNIGEIHSEFATNIVPDRCHMFAEVRSRNLDKLNAQVAHMEQCLREACKEAGAELQFDPYTNYVSYRVDPESVTVKTVLEAFGRMGLEPLVAMGGGGSDANIYNQKGIESVVLGTGMTKVHTTEETITVENLYRTAVLAEELLTH